MKEQTYGDIISKYPELIENGLKLLGREVNAFNRRIDLLFDDEYKRKLIVELKVTSINDKHVGQILDYYSSLKKEGARLMLISPKVPFIKKNTLDNLGIEWKEITFEEIYKFLNDNNDSSFDIVIPTQNNNILIQNSLEAIETPFGNLICHRGNGLSEIRFIDRFNPLNPKHIEIVTSSINANIYLRIEERLFEAHQNQRYVTYTYNQTPEKSWGFASSYRNENENISTYFRRVFWIHFKEREPRNLQLDISNQHIGNFIGTNIPQNQNNFQTWPSGTYLIIKDYLNLDSIEEIMDIICGINF